MQETSSATILNVDDNEPGRYAVTRLLRQAGYAVVEATTGAEALRLAAALPPDLVVLDVHLPDLSGLEVCRRLKADPATALIPILHLSATSIDSDNIAEGLEAGADAYLVEPVEAQVLVAQVRTLLRMRRLYQELAQAREQAEQQAQQLGVTLEELQVATEELEVANEGLRESEERYRSLAENVPCILMRYDRELRVTYLSPSAEEVIGFPVARFIGHTNREMGMPEALCDLWENALEEVFRSGTARDVEFDFPAAGGARTFYLRLAPEGGADGSILHVLGVSAEITARKQTEEALRQENREVALANRILEVFLTEEEGSELFDRALSIVLEGMQSKHGVFGYIAEPGHLFCPSLSKLLDECEVEGKCVHYPPEKWKGLWSRALLEKRTLYTNRPARVPPGHVPIRRNLAAPILFQDRVIGLLNLANKETDYTDEDRTTIEGIARRFAPVLYAWIQRELRRQERAQADQERERLQLDLLAAERARAEVAEHLNREISHRTKNNLAMVAGLLQMQTSESRNQEVTAALRDATARVLTFASIHEQLQTGSGDATDVLDLLRRIAHATSSVFAFRHVAVSVAGASALYPRAVATNLAVIANELITNAIKHGGPGADGELRVEVHVASSAGALHLAVWNSGAPVSADLDPATQRGLGLHLVWTLTVEQYRGSFTLRPHGGGSLAELTIGEEALLGRAGVERPGAAAR